MIRVLRGESPATIPFRVSANPQMVVDLGAAADFGVTIPPEVVARASTVIPVKGGGDTIRSGSPTTSATAPNTSRKGSPWDFWFSAGVLGLAFATLAWGVYIACLLYTSDAADERSSVDLGGRRIIKKK